MGVISLFHRGSAVGVISLFHRGSESDHCSTEAVSVGLISLFHRGSASWSDLTVPQRQCQWE